MSDAVVELEREREAVRGAQRAPRFMAQERHQRRERVGVGGGEPPLERLHQLAQDPGLLGAPALVGTAGAEGPPARRRERPGDSLVSTSTKAA